ncbi:MAG: hypothetical protein M1838_000630 [Thelocarpon superellum]|nr:MAG: hypothetical protein M1838_000630 [Thelocarpon superellum]
MAPTAAFPAGQASGRDTTVAPIKCITCKKIYNQKMYSPRQLETLSSLILEGGLMTPTTAVAICQRCAGKQIAQLTCCVCEEAKNLDAFSKSQRKSGDDADAADDPHGLKGLRFHNLTISENAKRGDDGSPAQNSSINHANGNMRAGSAVDDVEPGDWITPSRRGLGRPGGVRSVMPVPYTAYDAQGRAHRREKVPSSADSEESEPFSNGPVRSKKWVKEKKWKLPRNSMFGPGDSPPLTSVKGKSKGKRKEQRKGSGSDDSGTTPEW